MRFTIEEHIDSLKYHNHSHGLSLPEILEDCLIDKQETIKAKKKDFSKLLEKIRSILLDIPGNHDISKIMGIIDETLRYE